MNWVLDDDHELALLHVAPTAAAAVQALWRLDSTLGEVVATTSQPMIGQLRLTWWHGALTSLGTGVAPPQPVLQALAHAVIPYATPAHLAELVEGWEALLDPLPLPGEALALYAGKRGELFHLTALAMRQPRPLPEAGIGWALSDFAARCSDSETRARAWSLARQAFATADFGRLPRPLRILARLAAADAIVGERVERTRWRMWRATR